MPADFNPYHEWLGLDPTLSSPNFFQLLCATPGQQAPANFLEMARESAASQRTKKDYPPGWCANDIIADPGFVAFSRSQTAVNDYRLTAESAAIGKGIVLPAQLEDPFRPADGARPDIGAVPTGAEPLRVGRYGRVVAGAPSLPERRHCPCP